MLNYDMHKNSLPHNTCLSNQAEMGKAALLAVAKNVVGCSATNQVCQRLTAAVHMLLKFSSQKHTG